MSWWSILRVQCLRSSNSMISIFNKPVIPKVLMMLRLNDDALLSWIHLRHIYLTSQITTHGEASTSSRAFCSLITPVSTRTSTLRWEVYYSFISRSINSVVRCLVAYCLKMSNSYNQGHKSFRFTSTLNKLRASAIEFWNTNVLSKFLNFCLEGRSILIGHIGKYAILNFRIKCQT